MLLEHITPEGIIIYATNDGISITTNDWKAVPTAGGFRIRHKYGSLTTEIDYVHIFTNIYYCDEQMLDSLTNHMWYGMDRINDEFGEYLCCICDVTIGIINSLSKVYSYVDVNKLYDINFRLSGNQLSGLSIRFNIDDDFVRLIENGEISEKKGGSSIMKQMTNAFQYYGFNINMKSARK